MRDRYHISKPNTSLAVFVWLTFVLEENCAVLQ
uniref:Uncharacterized protein n=1 Tax=Anguilla anguilla TaxID=7936 RepID=A0A0E9V070_ANGAN